MRTLIFIAVACIAGAGCAPKAEHREAGPRAYPLPSRPDPGPSDAWPTSPERAEYLFTEGDLELLSRTDAGGGVTRASRIVVYSPRFDLTFKAKWKEVPYFLESWNNSPRRELAAYAVQKLFLDPDDYVVPTTELRCVVLEGYQEIFPDAKPTFEGSKCVLGVLALWIENVKIEPELLDVDRFATDANYAYHTSNFNILTYLIDHKDGRSNNFLVSVHDHDRRVFAIDNGISFDAWIWNWFVPNWDTIRVPALSRRAVDRLRQLTPADIDALAVVAELHLDDEGIYRKAPHGPALDPTIGVRTAPGIIQFGLMAHEVETVRRHVAEIVSMVDTGEVPVF